MHLAITVVGNTFSEVVLLRMHAPILSCVDLSIHLPSRDFDQDEVSHDEGRAVPNTASSSKAKRNMSIQSSAGSSATIIRLRG